MAKSCPAKVIGSIRAELNWVARTVKKGAIAGDVVNDLVEIDRRLAECSISGFGGYSKRNRRSRRVRRSAKRWR